MACIDSSCFTSCTDESQSCLCSRVCTDSNSCGDNLIFAKWGYSFTSDPYTCLGCPIQSGYSNIMDEDSCLPNCKFEGCSGGNVYVDDVFFVDCEPQDGYCHCATPCNGPGYCSKTARCAMFELNGVKSL